MSKYYANDQGHGINMLTDQYIDRLKGKKKVEIIEHLRAIGEQTKNIYATHLTQAALEGLIRDDDRLDMAKYIAPIFEEKGWKHKQGHIFRSTEEQAKHYGALLQGAGDELKKVGYKPVMKKKEEKK